MDRDDDGAFAETVEIFLEEYSRTYAESTMKARRRELMQLCRTVERLRLDGRISTQDPVRMTLEDVAEIASEVGGWGCSVNTRAHVLGRLNMICRFCGNMSVEHAKIRYPTLFPPKRDTRLGVLSDRDVEALFSYAERCEWFAGMRSCVSVIIPVSTGLRPQEVRMVRDRDFSDDLSELRVWSPKGADLYGEVRTVPVHPRAVPIITRYLSAFHGAGGSGYLFQNARGEPVSGNTQRMWRRSVSMATGVEFDHRALRRTWGQALLDAGVSEEEVSVLLGHASTATTSRYYARTREGRARDAARAAWRNR